MNKNKRGLTPLKKYGFLKIEEDLRILFKCSY